MLPVPKKYTTLFAVLICASITGTAFAQPSLVAHAPPGGDGRLDRDFDRFVSWFGGEWNNNEQVWQQKADAEKLPGGKPAEPISHTHHIFAPVFVPKVGNHTYYVQQHLDADMSKSYRQRLYRLSKDRDENAVRLEIFNLQDDKAFFNAHLRPEQLAQLDTSQLKAMPGCDVYWRLDDGGKSFTGTMKPGACSFFSQKQQKRIIVSDILTLTQDEIWINDQARDEQGNYVFGSKTNTPIINRKVRYFTGWLYMKRAGKDAIESDKGSIYRKDFVIHNEGQFLPILWDDGTPSPYMVELAQLTYQNTRTAILKLALVDKDTKKAVTYIWANTDATRLGMNLRWFQIGLTQKEDRPAYGFGDKPKPVTAPATR